MSRNESYEDIHKHLIKNWNYIREFSGNAHLVQVKSIERLGYPSTTNNTIRDVKVEFNYYGDVQIILKNKHQLPKGIYVNQVFPLEIEARRKLLLPIYKKARTILEYKRKC